MWWNTKTGADDLHPLLLRNVNRVWWFVPVWLIMPVLSNLITPVNNLFMITSPGRLMTFSLQTTISEVKQLDKWSVIFALCVEHAWNCNLCVRLQTESLIFTIIWINLNNYVFWQSWNCRSSIVSTTIITVHNYIMRTSGAALCVPYNYQQTCIHLL